MARISKMAGVLAVVFSMITVQATPARAQEAVKISQAAALASLMTRISPVYPLVAKQLRLIGDVDTEILVDVEGRVVDAKVLKGNAIFTGSAMDAVRKWRFRPIVIDGAVAKVQTVITFNFKQ